MTMKRKCRRAPQVRLILGYETTFMLTTQRIYSTRFVSSLMRGVSGDDPEGGAGSGVPRPRLVTADSGGPGPRLGALKLQHFSALSGCAPRRVPGGISSD